MKGAILEDADLKGASFQGSALMKTNLEEANLKGVYLAVSNLEGLNMKGANFKGTILSGANLRGANLENTIFENAVLENVNLNGATLGNSLLKNTNIFQGNLKNANLDNVNFEQAYLAESTLENSSCKNANFGGADLTCVRFYGANLDGAKFENVNLKNADLRGVDLSTIILNDANLQNIKIDKESIKFLPEELLNKHEETFIIYGNYAHFNDSKKIYRSIVFPPEYHQAGVSILNYFGIILRKKYPEQKAKIRIEQDGLKVSMIIEPESGEVEVIERALDEYGLVIRGIITPEEFADDPLFAIELKSELRLSIARIETQKELLQYKDVQIEKLYSLVDQFSKREIHANFNINVSPQIESNFSPQVSINNHIPLLIDSLGELIEKFEPNSDQYKIIRLLREDIERLEECTNAEQLKKTSSVSRLRNFVENIDKVESKIGNTINHIKGGIEIAQRIAGHYNSIAEWCGLPQVPKPFLKKKTQ